MGGKGVSEGEREKIAAVPIQRRDKKPASSPHGSTPNRDVQ